MPIATFIQKQKQIAATMSNMQYLLYAKKQGFRIEFVLSILFPAKHSFAA